LIRELRWKCLPFPSTLLVALALLSGEGCSGEPSAAVSTANDSFSEEEMAEMRKSAKSVGELRELMKLKLAQRAGANVTTKSVASKTKPR
jgi:hypothetical protein